MDAMKRGGTSLKHTLTRFAFLLVLAAPAFAQQSSPVTAKLVVPDTNTLPGVPFEMWIELRNPSDSAVSVGLFPTLVVQPEKGDRFEISDASQIPDLLHDNGSNNGSNMSITLAPGAMKTLLLPIRDGRGAQFLDDWRLSPPGRYTLTMRLDAYPAGQLATPNAGAMPVTFRGAVISNEVAIERIEPTGNDAKFWDRLQRAANGHWSQDCTRITRTSGTKVWCGSDDAAGVWSELLAKYPDSNYVPYGYLGSGLTDQYLTKVQDVIKRFPNSPVIELLHYQAYSTALSTRRPAVVDAERAQLEKSTRPTTRFETFHEKRDRD